MCRSVPVIAVFACMAIAAQANDGVEPSPKSTVLVPAAVAKSAVAPFAARAAVGLRAVARDPEPHLPSLGEQERRGPPQACSFALCYDAAERHLAYPGAREYMPTFAGLTPENISLRRNRIIFKYSFR